MLGLGPGLVAALLHAGLYVFVAAPLINGLGHWRGAQNFDNTAYNSTGLAWLTAGESLHNNHHAHPRAPKFSMRPVEFDPSWLVIRALAAVRLAVVVGEPVRVPADSKRPTLSRLERRRAIGAIVSAETRHREAPKRRPAGRCSSAR